MKGGASGVSSSGNEYSLNPVFFFFFKYFFFQSWLWKRNSSICYVAHVTVCSTEDAEMPGGLEVVSSDHLFQAPQWLHTWIFVRGKRKYAPTLFCWSIQGFLVCVGEQVGDSATAAAAGRECGDMKPSQCWPLLLCSDAGRFLLGRVLPCDWLKKNKIKTNYMKWSSACNSLDNEEIFLFC